MGHFTFSMSFKNSHLSFNLSIHLLRSGGAFDVAIMRKDIINHTNKWPLIIDGDNGNVSIS